jgi:pectinesterase
MPSYFLQSIGGSAMETNALFQDFNNPSRPDAIVVALGTNDGGVDGINFLNATFSAKFSVSLALFAYNLTRLWHSNYPALFFASGPITRAAESAILRAIDIAQAPPFNVSFVYFLNWTDAPLDGCDNHPGPLGHAVMANRTVDVIRAHFRQAQSPPRPPQSQMRSRPFATGLVKWAEARRNVHLSNATRDVASDFLCDYTVRADGSGDYRALQEALDACLAMQGGGHPALFRLLGVFRERVNVTNDFKRGVTIIGDGASPLDAVVIFNVSGKDIGTWASHTVMIAAVDVTLSNFVIANDAGNYDANVAAQSVALHVDVTADRLVLSNMALLGAQDTFYTGSAGRGLRSLITDTFINGTCDAIFGGSNTVFERATIEMDTTVTAHRGSPDSAYLFLGGSVTSRVGVLLGRPWGQLGAVVFRDVAESGVESLGWDDWSHGCTAAPPGSNTWCSQLVYAEANITGSASLKRRAWWSQQLNASAAAAWTRERVLGDWKPPTL